MSKDTSANREPQSGNGPQAEPANDEQFLIVGLGASAGGIHALKSFFTEVPKDSGMAYVVILHMSPEHESKLADILQTTSPIPVTQVRERTKVEPNQVYVIPPNQRLAMADGHLELKSIIGVEERRSPVDLFFRTLAESNEDRSVSVILSGTGANGSMGLKRVKEHGGVAFVQDPDEAEYTDMPRNAIATGMVDYVLPVAEIPAKIISYKDRIGSVEAFESPTKGFKTDEQALIEIFTHLRRRTGHDFSNYKRATILRRIGRRLSLQELPGLSQYADYVQEHPEEVQALMKDLLISVTNFFRDPEAIAALVEKALPRIFETYSDKLLRVWIPGCATGEEAYSLAMVFSEYALRIGSAANVQLFATDLDEEAVQIAREGYYTEAEVADLSPERLRRFFNRDAAGYRVRRELRELVLFAVHNVLKDPPFSHLDLVSCRNLLIYLNRTAQTRVMEILHFALNPGGHLFLGAAESAEGLTDLFSIVDKDNHIYRSRPVGPRPFPIPEIGFQPSLGLTVDKKKKPHEYQALERLSYGDLHQRLLEQYGPPSLIVNEHYDIVHLSNRAGLYLQLSGGEPSHNLLKLAREELRLSLRTALYQAVQDGINVDVHGLEVATDQGLKTINLMVRPVLREEDATRGYILVIFEEADQEEVAKTSQPLHTSHEPISVQLEQELIQAKAQLRTTVEQYEVQQEEVRASNEELQATNEELRSTVEELETSKEELQSVNEELFTVNQELKIKIEELSHANNNFQNLINSTNIGTIFLDRAFRVRQFTPSARETFNLIPSDLGRPLLDITSKVDLGDLQKDMEVVLRNLQPRERLVLTLEQATYILRIAPYRTLDDKIEGLVITLVDITAQRQAEEEVKTVYSELESRVQKRTTELTTSNRALRVEIADRARSEEARQLLLKDLVRAQEDERQRLARDLHDHLGQRLTTLRLRIESLKDPRTRTPATPDELEEIVKLLDADVDFLAWELRPIALDELGLDTALANFARQWSEHFDAKAEFHTRGIDEQRLPPEIESNLYRIAQEALNNCAKHAKCTHASIILERRDHHVLLIVEDNGAGFDVSSQINSTSNMGLMSMRERTALMGGTFDIESTPTTGTTIFVRVNLPGDPDE
jgi:two-component system, chemotaxis family, CheB/CheR fusion protein